MTDDHRCDWGHFGWGCSCGKGRDWPLAPISRGHAAAEAHLRAVTRRAKARRHLGGHRACPTPEGIPVTDPAVLAAIRRNHPPQAGKDFTTVCYECERAVEAARSIHYKEALGKAVTELRSPDAVADPLGRLMWLTDRAGSGLPGDLSDGDHCP